MNHFIKITFFLMLSFAVSAQNAADKNAISYKMLVTDYNTLDPQYRTENPDRIIHPDDVNFGMEAGYQRYLFSSVNAGASIRLGSVDSYHLRIDSADANCTAAPCNRRYYRNELFAAVGMHADYKFNNGYILKEDFIVAPYIRTGLTAYYLNKREKHFDLQIPFGLGVNIRLNPLFSLQAQFDYNQSLIAKKSNLVISAGFVWTLGKMPDQKEENDVQIIDGQ